MFEHELREYCFGLDADSILTIMSAFIGDTWEDKTHINKFGPLRRNGTKGRTRKEQEDPEPRSYYRTAAVRFNVAGIRGQ